MKINHKISRRTMVGGLGAGMLSIGIPPLFANITITDKVEGLEDPRGKIQSRHLKDKNNRGQIWRQKWNLVLIMANRVTKDLEG